MLAWHVMKPWTDMREIRTGDALNQIGREDLIAMKCFGGEPQDDIADAHAAVNNAQDPIDWDLLRRATRRFGRAAADVLEQAPRALIEAATLESTSTNSDGFLYSAP